MATVATAAPPALIRRSTGGPETRLDRMLKKQLPALVVSGALHVGLVLTLMATDTLMPAPAAEAPSEALLTVTPADEEDPTALNLTNPEVGLDPDLLPAIEAENLAEVNVATALQTPDAPGLPDAPSAALTDLSPPAGLGALADTVGLTGEEGASLAGGVGVGTGEFANPAFAGRGAATRSKLVKAGGGNSASEAAVGRGLVWLAKVQRSNGSWVFDGTSAEDTAAATGLALLPFLAAGQTHKGSGADNKYKKNVQAGITHLLSLQKKDGGFLNATDMYAHAIATVAICELLGMSGDTSLRVPAQQAVNYIIKAQAANGSWGYKPNMQGDTSIVGWQIQALQAARLCKGLVVKQDAIEKATKFLNTVSSSNNSRYGYTAPGSGNVTNLTAVGLLTRYYAEKWGPENPSMAAGVKFFTNSHPPTADRMDYYYYYYATQVMHFFGGEEHAAWNAKMRDLLVELQIKNGSPDKIGTWNPDDRMFGTHTGRLGATCLSLLTLEVYYRHLSLNKRDTAGLKELERGL